MARPTPLDSGADAPRRGVLVSSLSSRVFFRMRPIHRLGLFVGLVLALAMALPVAADSTHTVTTTTHFHGVQPFTIGDPCSTNPSESFAGTATTNLVTHETYFLPVTPTSEFWFTATEEDSFTVTDTVTGVVYTGHDTQWFGLNVNQQNSTGSHTFNARGTGSDGSTITYHENAHFTLLPDGTMSVTFDKISLTCG
jgi:hypothetical protein